MLSALKEYSSDLFGLFYPNVCAACSTNLLKGETTICLQCENQLPKTDHWQNSDNPLMKRFWGRVNVQAAAALYHFHQGSGVQHLLHQLKYKGRKDIGEFLGKLAGHQLQQASSIMSVPDLIIPVPLHCKKLRMRGYNQCEPFAEGLSQVLHAPVMTDCIERIHENISQTKKKRFDRWDNVAEIFAVKKAAPLKAKHVLLVDDVVTTGATAEACLSTILAVENTRVSFVAMAMAEY